MGSVQMYTDAMFWLKVFSSSSALIKQAYLFQLILCLTGIETSYLCISNFHGSGALVN